MSQLFSLLTPFILVLCCPDPVLSIPLSLLISHCISLPDPSSIRAKPCRFWSPLKAVLAHRALSGTFEKAPFLQVAVPLTGQGLGSKLGFHCLKAPMQESSRAARQNGRQCLHEKTGWMSVPDTVEQGACSGMLRFQLEEKPCKIIRNLEVREQDLGLCVGREVGFRQQEGLSWGRQKTKGWEKHQRRGSLVGGRTEWGCQWQLAIGKDTETYPIKIRIDARGYLVPETLNGRHCPTRGHTRIPKKGHTYSTKALTSYHGIPSLYVEASF